MLAVHEAILRARDPANDEFAAWRLRLIGVAASVIETDRLFADFLDGTEFEALVAPLRRAETIARQFGDESFAARLETRPITHAASSPCGRRPKAKEPTEQNAFDALSSLTHRALKRVISATSFGPAVNATEPSC
jgi:hypothetical protein